MEPSDLRGIPFRHGDRGVTYSMPAPLANRFSHFEVEVLLDDWVAWVRPRHR